MINPIKKDINKEVLNSKIAGEGLKYFAKKAIKKDKKKELTKKKFKEITLGCQKFNIGGMATVEKKELFQVYDGLYYATQAYREDDFDTALTTLDRCNLRLIKFRKNYAKISKI